MSKIGLIIKREYVSRVSKRTFLLMTILGPILLVGFMVGAVMLGKQEDGKQKVLIHDDTYVVSEEFEPWDSSKYELTTFDATGDKSYDDAIAYFKSSEDFDLLLYLPETVIEMNSGAGKILYKEAPSSKTRMFLERLVNERIEQLKLKDLEISMTTYKRLKNKVNLQTVDVNTMEESNVKIKAFIGMAFGVSIFMFIFMYGTQVMKGVIEEKSNRIVEVIVSSVKPFELMMGKIIGIMLVGLTQFAVWILLSSVLGSVAMGVLGAEFYSPDSVADMMGAGSSEAIAGMKSSQAAIINVILTVNWPLMIGLFFFYFIGGYLLYGSLMAAIGAAVDNETDSQQFMMPITAPLMFAYVIVLLSIDNPNSPAILWCSQIPFTSPVVMLVRAAMDADGLWWQIIISMVLLVITFIGTTWLAGKIYRTGILMHGKKITWKELAKWIKYKG
ncbi:MAG: ABC transporter permease [Flavobacteriales bacterium]|jgi:ABC-2 type transport system permease protein|nr:ABC transporter permease [Flavobacteriales bacterium]